MPNDKKEKRKELAAKLGEAVIRQAKQTKALNETSMLCNRLATQIEELEK